MQPLATDESGMSRKASPAKRYQNLCLRIRLLGPGLDSKGRAELMFALNEDSGSKHTLNFDSCLNDCVERVEF